MYSTTFPGNYCGLYIFCALKAPVEHPIIFIIHNKSKIMNTGIFP